MTHEELRKEAVRWLTNTKHCGVVLSELRSAALETPDAIGWKYGQSILVECKVSRSDFHANKDKPSVRAGIGMGRQRYFLCPEGLIKVGDLDDLMESATGELTWDCSGYGLLWLCQSGRIAVKKEAPARATDHVGEIRMLVSALRRVKTREFLTIIQGQEDEPAKEIKAS